MSTRLPRWVLLGAALTILSGCVSTPTVPEGVDQKQAEARWAQHRSSVSSIDAFNLQARIAGSALGVKADVRWQQMANGSFSIHVSGPFGAGAMLLRGTPKSVQVSSKDGTFSTDDPEAWLRDRLGWTLPIEGLRWWALGLPAPGSRSQLTFDAEGRLAQLEQDGWRLVYDGYQPVGERQLPRRLDATNGDVNFRLLADQWSL